MKVIIFMSDSNYIDILNASLAAIPQIKGLFLLDRNANVLAHAIGKEEIMIVPTSREEGMIQINKISISAVVADLSCKKILDFFKLGDLEHFLIKCDDGYIFFLQVDNVRTLLAILGPDARMGFIFLEIQRSLIDLIKKLPYSVPDSKLILESRLNELENEFIRKNL
jgi:predicted regulator of Ras-like GTPase activity (Roadblock/LC7/MglB family)